MNSIALRPAWTPVTIAALVIGFIAWWPLGLAVLAYILWGDRILKIVDDARAQFRGAGLDGLMRHSTGNSAFDEYRRAELDRLEAERRRLEQEAAAFEAYVRSLRQAKDKDEFDRFMAERRGSRAS
jgi:hypothetical protein